MGSLRPVLSVYSLSAKLRSVNSFGHLSCKEAMPRRTSLWFLPKTSATFKEVVVGMPFTRETRAVDIGNLARVSGWPFRRVQKRPGAQNR